MRNLQEKKFSGTERNALRDPGFLDWYTFRNYLGSIQATNNKPIFFFFYIKEVCESRGKGKNK